MDAERVRQLRATEAKLFAERTSGSKAMFGRAQRTLAGGVTSSFHGSDPWPVYIARGDGAPVWDLDGNEYLDFHNRFSAMVQGHAHPAIVAAVRERVALGTHFGATTDAAVAVARGRGAGAPLRPPALALHQLRHGGQHGGDPPRTGVDRAEWRGPDAGAPTTATPRSPICTRSISTMPRRSSGASARSSPRA